MFTYLKLKNYMSFSDVNINFLNKKNKTKNLVCIYGENGAGKSNIASAFSVLGQFTKTRMNSEMIKIILDRIESEKKIKIEDEDISLDSLTPDIVNKFYGDVQVSQIIKRSKTIDSESNMVMEFGFRVANGEGTYIIETDDTKIVYEKLIFTLNTRKTTYFEISTQNKKLNSTIFSGKEYKKILSDEIDKYWGRHSLLSILLYEVRDKNYDYISNNINVRILAILAFINSFSSSIKLSDTMVKEFSGYNRYPLLQNIEYGKTDKNDLSKLNSIEKFLNEIFCNLYCDIKEVYYLIEDRPNSRIEYTLYFKKMISGNLLDIKYNKESTGTLNLLRIIPKLFLSTIGDAVIIDEIDTGIHDILFRNILKIIKPSIQGQLIITTHNTYIMEDVLNSDEIYFINIDEMGNKKIQCLCDYDIRNRKNNNLRLRYLKGFFGGVPIPVNIEFDEVCDELLEELSKEDAKNNE